MKRVNVIARVFHHDGRKYEWPVVENKKIISGKINNVLSNDSHLYRGGGGDKNITYGHLLYYTQEVLNQIMLLTSYMKR